jgi:hypothetical protein
MAPEQVRGNQARLMRTDIYPRRPGSTASALQRRNRKKFRLLRRILSGTPPARSFNPRLMPAPPVALSTLPRRPHPEVLPNRQ